MIFVKNCNFFFVKKSVKNNKMKLYHNNYQTKEDKKYFIFFNNMIDKCKQSLNFIKNFYVKAQFWLTLKL